MQPQRSTLIRLAALVLPVCLLAGCEGDGSVGAELRDARPEAGPAMPTKAATQPDQHTLDPRAVEVAEATRDLGLVDPMQETRLDVASSAHGELSVEQLGIALLDENPSVRQEAVDALLGAPEAVMIDRLAQLRYALTDPDETVRESVVAVLEGSRDPRAIALLLQARGDESPIVREEAREALAGIRSGSAAPSEEFPHNGD